MSFEGLEDQVIHLVARIYRRHEEKQLSILSTKAFPPEVTEEAVKVLSSNGFVVAHDRVGVTCRFSILCKIDPERTSYLEKVSDVRDVFSTLLGIRYFLRQVSLPVSLREAINHIDMIVEETPYENIDVCPYDPRSCGLILRGIPWIQ